MPVSVSQQTYYDNRGTISWDAYCEYSGKADYDSNIGIWSYYKSEAESLLHQENGNPIDFELYNQYLALSDQAQNAAWDTVYGQMKRVLSGEGPNGELFSSFGVPYGNLVDEYNQHIESNFTDILNAIHIEAISAVSEGRVFKVGSQTVDLASFGSIVVGGQSVTLKDYFESSSFSIDEFSFSTPASIALVHFVRNLLMDNGDIEYLEIIRNADSFIRVSDSLNAFHKSDYSEVSIYGNGSNIKWTSANGLSEYIFKSEEFQSVSDVFNAGSYNFSPPGIATDTINFFNHSQLDVFAWIAFGNIFGDFTSPEIRGGDGVESALPPRHFTVTIYDLSVGATSFGDDSFFGAESERFFVYGYDGNDLFLSGDQDDTIDGGLGNDTVSYGLSTSGVSINLRLRQGYDGYAAYDNNSEWLFSIENIIGSNHTDVIVGSSDDNVLDGRAGNDSLVGEEGNDSLYGGLGDDYFEGNAGSDLIDGGVDGTDTAVFVGNYDDYSVSKAADGTITVVSGNFAELGTDTLTGIEIIRFQNFEIQTSLIPVTVDPETPDAGVYHPGTAENEQIWGASGDDNLFGAGGDDQVIGSGGNDYLDGGEGTDSLYGGTGNDTLASWTGDDSISGGDGNDAIYGWSGNDLLKGDIGNDTILGEGGSDVIFGGVGNDVIYGDGTEHLYGAGAADILYGGVGDDTLYGGTTGTDIADYLGAYDDYLITKASDGTITVVSGNSAELGVDILSGIESIRFQNFEIQTSLIPISVDPETPDAGVSFVGSSGNDTYFGGSGNDTLESGIGDDLLSGGAGDDLIDGGWFPDAGISYSSNGTFFGGAGNDSVFGGFGSDTIYAGSGNDYLASYGGAGVDRFYGGSGIDKLLVNASYINTDQSIIFEAGQTFSLQDGSTFSEVEELLLSTGAGNDTVHWKPISSSSNIVHGNVLLDQNSWAGGDGYDLLIVDTSTLTGLVSVSNGVVFLNSEVLIRTESVEEIRLTSALNGITENDLIYGSVGSDSLFGADGDDKIYGDDGGDTLYGGDGNDHLHGGEGVDHLYGGANNDIYFVGSEDFVYEDSAGGVDEVNSYGTFTLGANLENLILVGIAAINGTGNSLNNHITGNSSNNTLNGVLGTDTLEGGSGNDTYITDGGDTVLEGENDGTDTVKSSVSIGLANNVENLILTGGVAVTGLGNSLNNNITGNGLNNTLNGGTGTDTLKGGLGDDTYVTDGNDIISEAASAGNDRVNSSASYTLSANVERLYLTGTAAINGTGNSLDNRITGNAANNTLNGGTGIDTLVGGLGDDTYVTDGGDVISEAASAGLDTVRSSVNYILGANMENLLLTGTTALKGTGNSLNNRISGNAENNIISGGAGADTLLGGTGSDSLTGGADRDLLYGGVDTVRDVFIFNSVAESVSGATRDIVYNFASGTDDIKLNLIDANSLLAGDQAFGFNGTSATANSLWFVDVGTDIIVRGDISGDSVYDFEIRIVNINTVVAGDFIL